VDSRIATRELGDLVRRGILEQVGTRRWTTYRIVPELTGDAVVPPIIPERRQRPERTRADRRPAILALLKEHGELSRTEIMDLLSFSETATRWWLRILVQEGAVELTAPARSRQSRYRLPSQQQLR
jgi:ATP-dependent DNA helicase RecG